MKSYKFVFVTKKEMLTIVKKILTKKPQRNITLEILIKKFKV
jgi:hypothetical protein